MSPPCKTTGMFRIIWTNVDLIGSIDMFPSLWQFGRRDASTLLDN